MKSRKFLWFLLRLNLIVWLAAAATAVWLNGAEAAPEKVTLCHFGETKQVPSRAVESHRAHGDYLGPCVTPTPEPESIPASESSAHPLYTMWLLTRDFGVTHAKGEVVFVPAYWQCLIRSDTHPSEERQRALCFRGQYPNYEPARLRHLADEDRRLNGWWVADDAPCAAPVMSDGTWACDALTSWRYR